MDDELVNYEKLLNECDLEKHSLNDVLKTISSLQNILNQDNLVVAYNFLLKNILNSDILIHVINLVSKYKDSSTLSILIDLLISRDIQSNDTDSEIDLKVNVVKQIAKYKDTSTIGVILYCLNNKNENYKVRLACADALGRIGDSYAVTPLINILQDEEEKSVYVKESATFALGLIGDTSAVDPLVEYMEAKQGLCDKFSFLKEKIVETLGKLNINNSKVLKLFKSSIMDISPMVRINTIEALMNSEYPEAENIIKKALHDDNEEVQKNALIALYNITGRDILDEVISLPGYSKFLKSEAKSILEEYEND